MSTELLEAKTLLYTLLKQTKRDKLTQRETAIMFELSLDPDLQDLVVANKIASIRRK